MIRRLFELTEEHHSSLWFIAGICFLLFLWTAFMCYLPLWITVGQTGLSIISALGAGLMVGAAFTVVIPESIEGKQVTRIDLMDSSAKIEINKIFIPSSVSFIRKNTISGTVFYGGESVPSSFDSDWYEGTLFLNCKGLTEDENFKYILFNDGRSSLYEFKGTLTEVVIPESINGFAVYKIENNVFNNNDNITLTIYEDEKSFCKIYV